MPEGHDGGLLSHIIHDRDDGENVTNLQHVREATKPDGDEPHMGRMLDMMMQLVPRGEERIPSE